MQEREVRLLYGLQNLIINQMKKIDKTTREWKLLKLQQICRILDILNQAGNFCGIQTDPVIKCKSQYFGNETELCCKHCFHLGKNGCTTQSLMCKMSFCYVGYGPKICGLVKTKKQKQISEKRYQLIEHIIKPFIEKHNLPYYQYRLSLEDSLKVQYGELNINDLDIWTSKFVKK